MEVVDDEEDSSAWMFCGFFDLCSPTSVDDDEDAYVAEEEEEEGDDDERPDFAPIRTSSPRKQQHPPVDDPQSSPETSARRGPPETTLAETGEPQPQRRQVTLKASEINAFKERLVKGIRVVKHCRGGGSRPRILFADEQCTKIGWRKSKGTASEQLLLLAECQEVRGGTQLDQTASFADPKGRTLAGTETLRKCIDGAAAKRCFSLIFAERSVDFEVEDNDQAEDATKIIRYFRVLVQDASQAE